MLVFISKCYLLLAKSLSLSDLLSFLSLFLSENLLAAGFRAFVNEDCIKNLISSFALCFASYIIDLLIIINCLIWDI